MSEKIFSEKWGTQDLFKFLDSEFEYNNLYYGSWKTLPLNSIIDCKKATNFDFVELEREFFKDRENEYHVYAIVFTMDGSKGKIHYVQPVLIYKADGKFWVVDLNCRDDRGIHSYDTLTLALNPSFYFGYNHFLHSKAQVDVMIETNIARGSKQIESSIPIVTAEVYEYDRLPIGLDLNGVYKYITTEGKYVNLLKADPEQKDGNERNYTDRKTLEYTLEGVREESPKPDMVYKQYVYPDEDD